MKDLLEFLGEFIIVGLVIVLVISLIMIPIVRIGFNAEIKRYHAFKQTLENARFEEMSELERATILTKIADWNMDIANTKHWKKTIFGIYIPDEVTELEFIK